MSTMQGNVSGDDGDVSSDDDDLPSYFVDLTRADSKDYRSFTNSTTGQSSVDLTHANLDDDTCNTERSPEKKRYRRTDDVVVLSDSDSSDSPASRSMPFLGMDLSFDRLVAYFKGEPLYYLDDKELPILEKIPSYRKRLYSIEDIVQLLLFPGLQTSGFTCLKVPVSINKSVSFIVDLGHLENQKDLVADDMGVWKNNGVDTTRVVVTFSEGHVQTVRRYSSSLSTSGKIYSVKRVYRTHATDVTLKKVTSYLYETSDQLISYALVVYKFDQAGEHPVLIRPHGNAKNSRPYRRTRESTKLLLKEELIHNSPKVAVNTVFDNKGGLLEAKSAGELPRGRPQAYYTKMKLQQEQLIDGSQDKASVLSACKTRDMLFIVMEQCKAAQKSDLFVQDVTCAPEPMAVLCNEQQLNDIKRFCCHPFDFSILGIDPTFNLGDFSVTPMVYRHLLLEDKRSGHSPLLLGPLLVHYQKLFRSYNYFFSTLIGLKPEVSAIKAVGTDGEKNLSDAVMRNFPEATQVRCFRHLQQNIESHLREHKFSAGIITQYVHDIFGWRDAEGTYHEGLVDSNNISDFNTTLLKLKEKWNKLERDDFQDKSHKEGFHDWFTKFKAHDFGHYTLRSLRERIGLGSPPSAFHTNDSESINALLKESLGYKKHQWATFNEKIKALVKQQQQDMTKAIIGHGEYQLRSHYSFLAVSEDKWFQMSQQQRLHWINKFNTCQVQECVKISFTADKLAMPSTSREDSSPISPDVSVGRFAFQDNSSLSVSIQDMIQSTKLPYTSVEGMWRKASKLVTEANAVVCAPGLGAKDKMVKSQTGSSPHLVLTKASVEGLQYKCDDKCPHYKSVSICSHTIAAAEANGDLQNFLEWFGHHGRQVPNLTKLSTHGMPSGAGKKGSKTPRKKAVSKPILSDENRVPLNTQLSCYGTNYVSNAGNVNTAVCQKVGDFSSPVAACNAIFNPSDVSHMNTFNNYLPSPSNSWQAFPSSPNTPHYPYMWSNLHSPWAWSQSISPLHPHAPIPLSMTSPPIQQYESQPSVPMTSPSLQQYQSQPSGDDHFKVYLKTGNISVCNGCRSKFGTNDNIVVQHKEFRSYTNPHTGSPASKLGNAYYHLSRKCIEKKFGRHVSINIVVTDDVKPKLTSVHKEILSQEFLITL